MIWVSSDLHFGHFNILAYCSRPFKDVDEMNEALVNNWNAVVKPEDTVYLLGDVTFYRGNRQQIAADLLKRLNGTIILVKGNHDRHLKECVASRFKEIVDYKVIDVVLPISKKNQRIVLFHFPIASWDGKYHNSWHCFGHVHNQKGLEKLIIPGKALDVGVDGHDWKPWSLEEIEKEMNEKSV